MCLYRISSVGSAMQWGDGFRDRFVCWLVTCPVSGGRGWDFWEGYNLHMALSYMKGGGGGRWGARLADFCICLVSVRVSFGKEV